MTTSPEKNSQLREDIAKLKREKNAVILARCYQHLETIAAGNLVET
jgi:quinolinate synthase